MGERTRSRPGSAHAKQRYAPPARSSSQGPPAAPAGRDCATRFDAQQVDDETFKMRAKQMKQNLVQLQQQNADLKEQLYNAERDAFRKDKLLQELLATAKPGTGVPPEGLDRIREDLNFMLQHKKRAQELRAQIDERDQTVQAIQNELKASRIYDMEEQVTRAKKEAKLKASEWAQKCEEGADSQLFTSVQQHQATAKKLHQKVVQLENELTGKLQRQCLLKEEQDRLHETSKEFESNVERLETKRAEIASKKQEEEKKVKDIEQLEREHRQLTETCDAKFDELQRLQHEARIKDTSTGKASGSGNDAFFVSKRLFACKGPLKEGVPISGEASRLLWRLKYATEDGFSLTSALQAEDVDKDGFVTAPELTRVFARARVVGITQEAIQRLVAALDEGVVRDGKVSSLDLSLALPCMVQPESAVPESDLRQAIEDIVWACRRSGRSEQEFKSQLLTALTSGRDLLLEGAELCSQLGVDGRAQAAFGDGLDLYRSKLALMMPTWRSMTRRNGAVLVWRFLRDLNRQPADTVANILGKDTMSLGDFVQLGSVLGEQWAPEDLEDVAFHCCVPGKGSPVVDVARFKRALQKGLDFEFPDLADLFPDRGLLAPAPSQAVEQPPVARYSAPGTGSIGVTGRSPPNTTRSRSGAEESYGEDDFNEMSESA